MVFFTTKCKKVPLNQYSSFCKSSGADKHSGWETSLVSLRRSKTSRANSRRGRGWVWGLFQKLLERRKMLPFLPGTQKLERVSAFLWPIQLGLRPQIRPHVNFGRGWVWVLFQKLLERRIRGLSCREPRNKKRISFFRGPFKLGSRPLGSPMKFFPWVFWWFWLVFVGDCFQCYTATYQSQRWHMLPCLPMLVTTLSIQ